MLIVNYCVWSDCNGLLILIFTNDSGVNDLMNLNHVADMVRKQRTAPINEFEITHDSSMNTWIVTGPGLQRFVQMTNWRY